MATLTLANASRHFPAGTSVGAYPKSNWPATTLPSGAPVGSATASGTVASSGSLSISGLADDTRYYLGASVSGTWKYVSSSTPPASTDGSAVAASSVTFTPTGTIAATDAQTAIAEAASEAAQASAMTTALSAKQDASTAATDAELAAHTGASSGAHAASAISFSPAGDIAATTVQAAVAEVDTEKAPLTEKVNAVSGSGSTETLPDNTTATVHRLVLDANCTLTFPTAAAGKSFLLVLVQDATGSRTVTWPGAIKWPGGTAPTLTTTASKIDVFSFICADGTNWLGFTAGQSF